MTTANPLVVRLLRVIVGLAVVVMSVTIVSLPATAAPTDPPAVDSGNGTPTGGATNTDPNDTGGTNATTSDPTPSGNGGGSDDDSKSAIEGTTGLTGQAARSSLSAALNKLGLWTTPCVQEKESSCAGNTGLNSTADNQPNWFVNHYRMMRVMGLYILMPMVLIAIIHAVMKASVSLLLKSVFLFLPLSIIGTAVAIDLVQLMLKVTDDFSAIFINSIVQDSNVFFEDVAKAFGDKGGIPFLLNMFLGIVLAIVCLFVYVIMVVREGSIYIATSFLPIGFALMVWPATAKWFKRMVEFLFGIILSKIVMVAAISLAVASLAAVGNNDGAQTGNVAADGSNVHTVGITASHDTAGGEITNIISAIALLLIVCFAPSMTVGLVARLGIGEMASHVGNGLMRPSGISQLLFYDRLMGNSRNLANLHKARSSRAESIRLDKTGPGITVQRLGSLGIHPNEHGNFALTLDDVKDVDVRYQQKLIDMTNPSLNADNANDIMKAYGAAAMGADFEGFQGDEFHDATAGVAFDESLGTLLLSKTNRSKLMINVTKNRRGIDADGLHRHTLRRVPKAMLRRVIETEADRQIGTAQGFGSIDVIVPMRTVRAGDSVQAKTNFERQMERDIKDSVRDVRKKYESTDVDGTPKRVNINASFRAPSSVYSRVNRDLNTDTAEKVKTNFG